MCLICIDLNKNIITYKEALRNLDETKVNLTKQHYIEIQLLIAEKEREDEESGFKD